MNPRSPESDPVFTSFRTLPCSHHGVDRPAHHELSGHAESVPDSNPRFNAIPAVIMSFDATTNRQSIEKRTATRSIGRQSHFHKHSRMEISIEAHKGVHRGRHEDFSSK